MARSRSDDYDDKRLSILEGAAALFAENGFERTSIAELARQCNASKAWIYHYYASKEAILHDMLDRHVRLLLATAQEALDADLPPEAQLRRLLRALMAIYLDTRAKHVVLINDLGALPPGERASLVALQNELVQIFAALVGRLRPELEAAPALRTPLALALLGMLNWTYTWFRADGPLTPQHFADLAADLFLGGLAGVRPPERS